MVYAAIEAADKKGGIFRSTDVVLTWEKRNDFGAQAQYYAHLVVDPENAQRVRLMNVLLRITNADWFVTQGGDGFQCKVDPKDPNIVYAEMQYGGLVRYDRRTGQRLGIQPQPGKGEVPLRWNWDSPLLISPHSHTRIYFAANRLFRSDDRGDSWKAVSGDLSRQLNRDQDRKSVV